MSSSPFRDLGFWIFRNLTKPNLFPHLSLFLLMKTSFTLPYLHNIHQNCFCPKPSGKFVKKNDSHFFLFSLLFLATSHSFSSSRTTALITFIPLVSSHFESLPYFTLTAHQPPLPLFSQAQSSLVSAFEKIIWNLKLDRWPKPKLYNSCWLKYIWYSIIGGMNSSH